jgi:hypothetical protein
MSHQGNTGMFLLTSSLSSEEEASPTSGPTTSIVLAAHLGRQEIGELLFTIEGRSEVRGFSVEGDGPVKTEG